ncbi:hypothetical protein THRCLA_21349 [Thraustotheca clavata]|uniref:Serine protease family S33 n=1 Tax=Thraustotheca clavata TaxID=74557 RepID=A0A1V9ZXN7_9STRA|nr:hypothetical protein THRCLA_21349 [Thraustotheca clavata]
MPLVSFIVLGWFRSKTLRKICSTCFSITSFTWANAKCSGTPKDDLTYALLPLCSTNFDKMDACVKSLKEQRLPSFVAYAQDNFIVKAKATKYLGDQLHDAVQIAHPKGGHNIQKNSS